MKEEKAIFKFILQAIQQGKISDVGYCFDNDPHTVQFRIGSVICRVRLGNLGDTVSVSYGSKVHWAVRQRKICEALVRHLEASAEQPGKVAIPHELWQKCYWSLDKDMNWHIQCEPVSLKQAFHFLSDPNTYKDQCPDVRSESTTS